MNKPKRITSLFITHRENFSGESWEVKCPICKEVIEITNYNIHDPKCFCGYRWKVLLQAVGEKD